MDYEKCKLRIIKKKLSFNLSDTNYSEIFLSKKIAPENHFMPLI